jgi:hypothetical protein
MCHSMLAVPAWARVNDRNPDCLELRVLRMRREDLLGDCDECRRSIISSLLIGHGELHVADLYSQSNLAAG